MEVKAKARFIRMSPRKVRLVIDIIRGKSVREARIQLQFVNKAAAEPVLKLLNSAAANAQHNFNLDEANLFVREIRADEGPTLGRWRARAFGRAAPIRKRTTHITIVLDEKNVEKNAGTKKEGKKVIQNQKIKAAKPSKNKK